MSKLVHVDLENFTAFSRLSLDLSPGVNVIIGANGTGKTHLLKVLYAACAITVGEDRDKPFELKLRNVFRPYQDQIRRLANRKILGYPHGSIRIAREGNVSLAMRFSSQTKSRQGVRTTGESDWKQAELRSVYIPVKEMLAHAPGFLSTVAIREIAFEDIYSDILKRAYLPMLKRVESERKRILEQLQHTIEGKVVIIGEHFFLRDGHGDLEFALVAEGIRKLALLWLLIQNGTLHAGSVLFWDEPEANINPNLMGVVVDILLELQRMGVQVILATHNYVILKEFDLRRRQSDALKFISLFRDEHSSVQVETGDEYIQLNRNAIADTFSDLLHRDMARALGKRS